MFETENSFKQIINCVITKIYLLVKLTKVRAEMKIGSLHDIQYYEVLTTRTGEMSQTTTLRTASRTHHALILWQSTR